jgi:hypothetical protein
VKDDTRNDVRALEEQIKTLKAEALRLQKEVAVQEQDLEYLHKLEGFTHSALTGLTEKGRLDSEAVVKLSKFIMRNRGVKTDAETGLRRQLQANTEAEAFARSRLAELSDGSSRVERDAVIVVQKTRREAGAVRLGYLVGSATWSPLYRLRGAADDAPVRLEYLAAVSQQTGENWPGVRVTLSTARPSQESAPPDLLPLKMAVSEAADSGPVEAPDDRSRRLVAELEKPVDMSFSNPTPLEDVIKYIRTATSGPAFPGGVPIYIDPVGLLEAEKTMTSTVSIELSQFPLRTTLRLLLDQLGLKYTVKDGLIKVTSTNSDDQPGFDDASTGRSSLGRTQTAGGAELNWAAAGDQAEELRVADGVSPEATGNGKDNPSVSFNVAGPLDLPSRRDAQLLEVARVEMSAEYYDKAVPVLTPRVFRLAKLTNKSDLVILPGDATVHVAGDFVGRMRLPLVSAGEPFIAGFGVDPQVQVSRRLLHKARTVQGGNQIFTYEFRLGLRNYRPGPVKVELWDRLPKPQGEAVAISLMKTSVELSSDAMYTRTARMDNLLRWDLQVPQGTVGDKTFYLNYELRLEYARDLPQPHFISGGLSEAPIGGGAMGGMGGMGGGMR